MYLFGFGSLINLKSAQKSFTRVLSQNDLIPVEIKGYKRVWNSIENIKFKDNDEEINGVFLNLQKDENASVNGVIIKITQSEFEILKLREKNYSQIKIKSTDILKIILHNKHRSIQLLPYAPIYFYDLFIKSNYFILFSYDSIIFLTI